MNDDEKLIAVLASIIIGSIMDKGTLSLGEKEVKRTAIESVKIAKTILATAQESESI